MSVIHTTPEADADLAGIRLYYRTRSPVAGRRLLALIRRRFALLAAQPNTGRPRPDLQQDLRAVVVRPYVIYFRPADDGVSISRVVHGSRRVDPTMFPG